MTSRNLARRQQTNTAVWPWSHTGRLERNTERTADVIAAEGYLDGLQTRTDARSVEAVVEGAIAIQHAESMGLADYGDAVEARLAHAGPLARRLIAESLPGAVGRISAKTSEGIRQLGK